MKKLTLQDAIEYVNRVAQDATDIAIHWAFDKRMAFVGRSDFNGEHFIKCLKVVMAEIGTGAVKKVRRVEFTRGGGTKPKLTTPKSNIKPIGQKPKRILKRPIVYNDRVVGVQ